MKLSNLTMMFSVSVALLSQSAFAAPRAGASCFLTLQNQTTNAALTRWDILRGDVVKGSPISLPAFSQNNIKATLLATPANDPSGPKVDISLDLTVGNSELTSNSQIVMDENAFLVPVSLRLGNDMYQLTCGALVN